MKRRQAGALCLVTTALMAASATKVLQEHTREAAGAAVVHTPRPRAVDVFTRMNDERRARGLPALHWDQHLADAAVHWSHTMSVKHRMFHSDIGRLLGAGADGYNYVGENIARGSRGVPASALHVGWMRSAEHRLNMLSPGFQRAGVGFACGDDGSVWATVNFGRLASSGPSPAIPASTPALPIVRADSDTFGCH